MITFKHSDLTKDEIYLGVLPHINSGSVSLLHNKTLLSQFSMLQRSTQRSGREVVDHPRNAHDDVSNAVSGVLVMSLMKKKPWEEPEKYYSTPDSVWIYADGRRVFGGGAGQTKNPEELDPLRGL